MADPYDPPRIEERTSLEGALAAQIISNQVACAAFFSVVDETTKYDPPRIEARTVIGDFLVGALPSGQVNSAVFRPF